MNCTRSCADASLAGREDALELRDDRLRLGMSKRQDGHRLVLHPIGVEGERRFDRRLAIGAVAENDEKVARRFGADRAGPHAETVDQADQRLRRDVTERQYGDAVAGACIADVSGAGNARSLQRDAIGLPVADECGAVHLQDDLEHRQKIVSRDRTRGGHRHRAGDVRIDDVVFAERIPEDRLHHLADVGVLEIQGDVARLEAGDGLPARVGLTRCRDRSPPGARSTQADPVPFQFAPCRRCPVGLAGGPTDLR